MKTSLKFLLAVALTASLAAVIGCSSVQTSYTPALGVPTFPPTNPTNVQILLTEPIRPHIRLGNVQAEPVSTSVAAAEIEEAIRKEAAKMGADAAVIVYDRTQLMGAVVAGPWYGRTLEGIEGRVVIAVAIKYQ